MMEQRASEPTTATKAPLYGMFTAVPPRYDLINRIVTLGMDNGWRDRAALTILEANPQTVLDLGCGTGDLALTVARFAIGDIAVTGVDYSPPMLELAEQKAASLNLRDRVKFVRGEATSLPFPEASFDCVGIAFAFRNLTYNNPVKMPHLAQVLKVLKPGGRYVIVESSQPENVFIRACAHFYLRAWVGPIGTLISGNKGAYRYLATSARRFYSPREVREMLISAGFREVRYRPLFFGAAGIHVAMK
jgi:demethylmenaquinone methyltransferase/2-methoxy-6-polyprenyl-1,4-benzoquinol methylase